MLAINCSSTIKGFTVNVVLNDLACTFCFAGVLKTVDLINLQQEERQTTLGSLFSVSGFSVILDQCVKLTCDHSFTLAAKHYPSFLIGMRNPGNT